MMHLIAMILLVAVLGTVALLNPYDIFTKESEFFTMERFWSIEVGTPVSEAIALMGEPILIGESDACEGCKFYQFSGEYPDWVWGGTECWYLVDADSRVLKRIRVIEP